MFDNNQQSAPDQPGSKPQQGGAINPPTPQPNQGGPSLEKNIPPAPAKAAGSSGVEDIFSVVEGQGAETKPKPPVFQPKEPSAATITPQHSHMHVKEGNSSQKIFAFIVIFLVLGLIGYGGWYAFNKFFQFSVPEITIEENQDDEIIQDEKPPVIDKVHDTDQDGLSDEEEKKLGTDIDGVDTDNDGLFDREEVKVYKTDPLNEDSDGDGNLDGQEVKNGYDPLGSGVLFDRGGDDKIDIPEDPETPEDPTVCPDVCTALWEIKESGCTLDECGSGCGADGVKSFDTEVECLRVYNRDSDNDGLIDREELRYGSDPDNPDSDADGYLDGQEVKGGYSPIGEGKL